MEKSAQEKRNLEAAKRANWLWNHRRIDEYVETLAPDHVFRSVALPAPVIGREAYRSFLVTVFQTMPDWQISDPRERQLGVDLIPPIYASGEFVTVPSLNSGTLTDGFLNLPPTDQPWSFFSCTVYQFQESDGKLRATWAYWNPMNVLQDLGVGPASTFGSSSSAPHRTFHSQDADPWGGGTATTWQLDEALSDVMMDVLRFPFRIWFKILRVLRQTQNRAV